MSITDIHKVVLLPTHRFHIGWDTQRLSREEIFNIWGLIELTQEEISVSDLSIMTPMQPLGFIINSFLIDKSKREIKKYIRNLMVKQNCVETSTFLKIVNTRINNVWIEPTIIENNESKVEKSPVPVRIWNERIFLSFLHRRGLPRLKDSLRTLDLRYHRRTLLVSFVT